MVFTLTIPFQNSKHNIRFFDREKESVPTMRRVTLSLTGLSCQSCVKSVHGALSKLVCSSEMPVPEPVVDLGTSSAIVFVPPHITDGQIVEAVAALGPTKKATVFKSQSVPSAEKESPSASSRTRYERRYRCGCSNLSCCCSKTPVIKDDVGVLITVVINARWLTPGFPTLSLATSCRSCSCGDTDICSCSGPEPETKPAGKDRIVVFDDDQTSNSAPQAQKMKAEDTMNSTSSPMTVESKSPGSSVTQPSEPTETRVLVVSGMTCASCAGIVTNILNKVQGVEKAGVSALTARAILTVSSTGFDIEEALHALKKNGYSGIEVQDVKPDDNVVHLRFSTSTVAEKACETLRSTPGVVSASIFRHEGTKDTKTSNTILERSRAKTVTEPSSSPVTQTPPACKKRSLWSWWGVQNREKPIEGPAIVRLESLDKLEAAKKMAQGNDPYEVLPRSDPILSGSLDTSTLLQREATTYFQLFLGALIFTLPVAFITMLFGKVDALGAQTLKKYVGDSGFRIKDIIAWILATPVQFIFGFRFYVGSWYALKRFRANMDVLIALGTSIAYAFSIIVPVLNTFRLRRGEEPIGEAIAFETSALLITIVLFGKWMESVAKKKTAAGIESLVRLAPRTAVVVSSPPKMQELFETPVDVEFVSPGDCVKVTPGVPFPVDGVVVFGETHVDESMLTGETNPVGKALGDEVFAGTSNLRNPVVVRCTSGNTDSMLAKIVELVRRAQESRAPIEAFADLVSACFVPFVVLVAIIALIIWVTLAETQSIPLEWYESEGSIVFATLFALSVLVIACPCALGLATPTAVMVATSLGARRFGILYRDGGEALQAARKVGTILFDKTGTLTQGQPTVTTAMYLDADGERNATTVHESTENDLSPKVLSIIGAAESFSDHPLAHAITQYCIEHSSQESADVSFAKQESLSGRGIRCLLESGGTVEVGSPDWVLSSTGKELSPAEQKILKELEEKGNTVVLAHVADKRLLVFGVEDPLRPESQSVISYFHSKGIQCGIVTGDGRGTALNVALRLGIEPDFVWSRTLPADKMEKVRLAKNGELETSKHANGNGVVFVGDGINDAAALSAASVGIAMGSGSQIASENAGIVLAKSNLWDVVVALDLAEVAFRRLKLNYVWALGFNTLGVPMAAGVLYPVLRARLPPFAAAVAMALSSISVIVSSLTLNLYRAPKLARGA